MNSIKKYPVKCYGCAFQCNMNETNNLRMLNCLESQYIIWPEGNFYLEKGITTLLKDTYFNIHSGGILYVDFTHYHLAVLADDAWLKRLKKIPMNIMLLADSAMEPLANFWRFHDDRIVDVIPIRKCKSFTLLKQTNSKPPFMKNKMTRATGMEMKVLQLLIAGHTVKAVAHKLNITSKSVYNLQYSLERKIGKSFKALMIN